MISYHQYTVILQVVEISTFFVKSAKGGLIQKTLAQISP
jgi:hypothetical protein